MWPSRASHSYAYQNQRIGRIMRGAGKMVEHVPQDHPPLLRFDVRCSVVDALSKNPSDWCAACVVLPRWDDLCRVK
jgi:hypothetical protein